MCVIAVYENNYPVAEDLINMESMNQHFGGIAWISDGKIKYRKGINAKEMMIIIKEENIKLPFVVHFRIASIGGITKELNHPFPISENVENDLVGEAEAVLFHNGTWSEYSDYIVKVCITKGIKAPIGQLSDSRTMAWLAHHYGSNFVKSAIDDQSKVIIFTPNGIEKFGKWHEFKKDLVSNTYFEKPQFSYGSNDFFGLGHQYDSFHHEEKPQKTLSKKQKKKITRKFSNLSYRENNLLTDMLDSGKSYEDIEKAVSKFGSINQAWENWSFSNGWMDGYD